MIDDPDYVARNGVSHKPTRQSRSIVESMAAVGVPHEEIARILSIDPKTLRKHYRQEIDTALTKANAKVGGSLYKKALKGDTSAIIWWEKTRAGKKDVSRHEHGGDPDNPVPVRVERLVIDPKVGYEPSDTDT